MYTCSYNNFMSGYYNFIDVSSKEELNVIEELIPSEKQKEIWDEKMKNMEEDESIKYYTKEYFNEILSKLDPNDIFEKIKYSVIIGDENRHVIAEWLHLTLDIDVQEVAISSSVVFKLHRSCLYKECLNKMINKDKKIKKLVV